MKNLIAELRASLVALLLLVVLCGGIYPVAVWAIAQAVFPHKANGSLVRENGKILGSSLLAQGFSGPAWFHPRPSAAGHGYDATSSGGTNLGPTSRKLIEDVRGRVAAYRAENSLPSHALVPADAVTSSASGLDPHISVLNARLQAGRVAASRGMTRGDVLRRIEAHTEGRDLGIFGEPRVNVLLLNLDLDGKM